LSVKLYKKAQAFKTWAFLCLLELSSDYN